LICQNSEAEAKTREQDGFVATEFVQFAEKNCCLEGVADKVGQSLNRFSTVFPQAVFHRTWKLLELHF